MNTIEIQEALDRLAEFESQRDQIEVNKCVLLDEVKIPAEVEEIVRNGMKQMGEVEGSFAPTIQGIQNEAETKLALIVVPDEIKAALTEIDRQRAAIRTHQGDEEVKVALRIRAIKAEIQTNVEEKTKDVYAAIAQRKAEIEAEFAGKAEAVDENIKKLTEEIKAEIRVLKVSVKAKTYQAVYNKGRITWNTDKMEAWIIDHPFLKEARKEGDPSVTIRKV
ncbi:MAG: hypothetical protein A2Y53_04965 [Chloroflexi bacterium RBG_16_47_49]|nr:MAG: hypothetical protein A2Y53_04965 [Chloroflexi bacterium RBG_16_47_49]